MLPFDEFEGMGLRIMNLKEYNEVGTNITDISKFGESI